MPPLIFLHDGSFEGLLTAVALAVKADDPVHGIYSERDYVPSLFDRQNHIATDADQAKRLLSYIAKVSPQATHITTNGFLSEERRVGDYLYEFVKLSLKLGEEVLLLHSNDAVRFLLDISRRVDFEAHRLTGMLRFRILENGIQYGPFSPDHNVIGYLAKHFLQRFGGRQFLLHDLNRDFALFWDGNRLDTADINDEITAYVKGYGELPDEQLGEEEKRYQRLWKSFHATIANPDRENRLLQRRFMPRRYWHFMVEMK